MLMFLLLLCGFPFQEPEQPDEDTQLLQIQAIVSVLVQSEQLPPEFAESATEKLEAMPPDALPHVLRLLSQVPSQTQEQLDTCGRTILQNAKTSGVECPESYFQKFASSTKQDPAARRIALRWLDILKPGAEETFLREHLSDDAFRSDAISSAIRLAATLGPDQKNERIRLLRAAFHEVQDIKQGEQLTEALQNDGITVEPRQHLGIVTNWQCETEMLAGVPVFSRTTSERREGTHDSVRIERTASGLINHLYCPPAEKETRFLLRSEVRSNADRPVQIRISCNRVPEFHVNGEEIKLVSRPHDDDGKLSLYSNSISLLRGENTFALKFAAAGEASAPNENANTNPDSKSDPIQFCVQIVDDQGKGIHAPEIIESLTNIQSK
ncbi:MAG: hypothetical protein U0996_20375 [Planctomycetaceae bacterium]